MIIQVLGTPAPQGSKNPYVNRHTGRVAMVESSAKVKPWRQDVKYAALDVVAGTTPLDGPVTVSVKFFLVRPKGHYRTGRNAALLRDGAPARPVSKMDLDKLIRSTLDGLGEAGVWGDDGQVTTLTAAKRYADNRPPGAVIHVAADRSTPGGAS